MLSGLLETAIAPSSTATRRSRRAALEALVWPNRHAATTFVGLVHRFGVELAGLASVGENPFAALSWVLPETARSVRHARRGALLGREPAARPRRHPGGTTRRGHRTLRATAAHSASARSARDLDADERERFPTLAAARRERDAVHVRTIAAEFDTAEEIVRGGRGRPAGPAHRAPRHPDPRALRRDGARRTGRRPRPALLRSIATSTPASREVHELLDADDVFIVMSDHGIRTAMEHSRYAIFVATGPGSPERPRRRASPICAASSRVARRPARRGDRLARHRRRSLGARLARTAHEAPTAATDLRTSQ